MKVKKATNGSTKASQQQPRSSSKSSSPRKDAAAASQKAKLEPILFNQNSNSCSNDTNLSAASSSTLVATAGNQQTQIHHKEAKVRGFLKELQTLVKKCHQERLKNEPNLTLIMKTHDRLKKEDKLTKFSRNKLRSMYSLAMKESENEIKCLRELLDCINQIRHTQNDIRILQQQMHHQTFNSSPTASFSAFNGLPGTTGLDASLATDITGADETLNAAASSGLSMRRGVLMSILQQAALTLPLWVGEIGQSAPPLCGSMPPEPHYMCKIGDKVAALIKNSPAVSNSQPAAEATPTNSKGKNKKAAKLEPVVVSEAASEEEENWILAEVVGFNSHSGRYDVDDVDAPEGQQRHSLGKRRVVPLPLWRANPLTDPLAIFPKDSFVLALYPQTTCFYRGIVYEAPQTPQDDYQILFEDNTYPEGYSPPLNVPQLYVVAHRSHKK